MVGELAYKNKQLLMFSDYSVETQKLCWSFDFVKATLRTKGIKYSVLFLAKVRVVDGATVHFFYFPERRIG